MRPLTQVLTVTALVGLLASGCAGMAREEVSQYAAYSSMDSTALVYSDPVAMSPLHDHPLRWVAFLLNPAGVLTDYGINRPVYGLAAGHPGLFGYNSEDAMLSSQRPNLLKP